MYKLNETVITVDGKEVVVYGITADKGSVYGISTDREFVEKLICDFNSGGLDALQLEEAIEDAFGSDSHF